jgi:hypothetical protein
VKIRDPLQAWEWATRPDQPGPKISGLGRIFWPDGRAWAPESWHDCLLGPGLGSNFERFWEGLARQPDDPTRNSSLGAVWADIFCPDSRARPRPPFSVSGFFLARPNPARPEKMPRYTPLRFCWLSWNMTIVRAHRIIMIATAYTTEDKDCHLLNNVIIITP